MTYDQIVARLEFLGVVEAEAQSAGEWYTVNCIREEIEYLDSLLDEEMYFLEQAL